MHDQHAADGNADVPFSCLLPWRQVSVSAGALHRSIMRGQSQPGMHLGVF